MHFLSPLPILLLAASTFASPLSTRRLPDILTLAAFGDSFSAGIGAGKFYTESVDGQDNKCARMTDSYPAQLAKWFFRGKVSRFDFLSCSGDVLNNIDGQVEKLGGRKVDVATLSISGNDFLFGNVVKNCVYATKLDVINPFKTATGNCKNALDKSRTLVDDKADQLYKKYREKIELIQKSLSPEGVLYITGYAKFFDPKGKTGDQCDDLYFFNSGWIRTTLGVLKLKWTNRQTMNQMVDDVNGRIQSEVMAKLQNQANVVFVDIDSHFDGHRFCELGQDPWGSNEERVYFNDLYTTLDETGKWDGPADNNAAALISLNLTTESLARQGAAPQDLASDTRGIGDKYQQTSTFHPKKYAHKKTAAKIFADLAPRSGHGFVVGPGQICGGFAPGSGSVCFDVPEGCTGANQLDNTVPIIACKDGTVKQGV